MVVAVVGFVVRRLLESWTPDPWIGRRRRVRRRRVLQTRAPDPRIDRRRGRGRHRRRRRVRLLGVGSNPGSGSVARSFSGVLSRVYGKRTRNVFVSDYYYYHF